MASTDRDLARTLCYGKEHNVMSCQVKYHKKGVCIFRTGATRANNYCTKNILFAKCDEIILTRLQNLIEMINQLNAQLLVLEICLK